MTGTGLPRKTLRLRIHGRVQGVFFRDSMRRQAEALRVAGWVRNCDDGSVEAVVHGTADDVIPLEHGQKISKALPHGTLLEVPEGTHTNLYKSPATVSAMVAHAGG